MATVATGCSVYEENPLIDGGRLGVGGSTGVGIGGAGGGSAGSDGLDASIGGGGGTTGGKGGAGGKGDSGGATGGASGSGGNGTGGTNRGDASGTGGSAGTGATTGTGGSAGAGATTGTGGSGGAGAGGATGGTGGAAGTGGATGGTGGGTGGATGGTGGTTGGAGGSGGTMDAAPEAPPPPGAAFAVGSFTKNANTGTQTVPHGLGQAPKALILWTNGKTSETLSSGFYYGVGISDSSTSVSLAMSAHDGVSPSATSRRIAAKAITLVQWDAASTIAEADLASWSGGNFQLNWTTNDGQPYVIHYLAIGGPQVSAKIVNWQTPTAAGQKAITGLGFQPEAVLHFYAGAAFVNVPPYSQVSGVIGMGAMDKTGAEWAIQAADANGQNPTIASRAQRNYAAIYMYTDTGTVGVTKQASFVAMTSGGFTLNFTTANTSASQVYSLALAGLKAGVGTFNKSTGAAPASQAVTTGFTPGAVLLTSYQMAAQTSQLNESICSFGIGASDGVNEASSALTSADAVATSSIDGQDKTSKAFIKMNMPPLDAEADMASFGPTGFTLNWTTNDTVASQMCFLALGAP